MRNAKASGRKGREAEGTLFVISAPSGAGKTTLCRRLLTHYPDIKLSVSYTTREPRKGEKNNIDYTFITKNKFMGMVAKKEFAEWAVVHGNLYGTSIQRLRKLNIAGYDILLDIDTRGAMQLKKNYRNAVFIFVLPPSFAALKKRLSMRKTDSRDVITKRLDNAKAEIAYYYEYDYVIINDTLDKAYRELESIIMSFRLKTGKIDAGWIQKHYNVN